MNLPVIFTAQRLPLLIIPLLLILFIPLHLLLPPDPIHIAHYLTDPALAHCAPLTLDRSSPRHRIMILQHFSHHDSKLFPLSRASMASHERYAVAHGYVYRPDEGQYIPETWDRRRRSMNKVHALLRAVLDELSRGDDAVEWIMLVPLLSISVSGSDNALGGRTQIRSLLIQSLLFMTFFLLPLWTHRHSSWPTKISTDLTTVSLYSALATNSFLSSPKSSSPRTPSRHNGI